MVGWEGGRFLVLFKDGGCRVQNFIFLFLMLIKETKKQDGIAIGIACTFLDNCSWEVQMWKNGVTSKEEILCK